MTETGDLLLSVRDLAVEFEIKRGLFQANSTLKAVDGISFDLRMGETLGVVGESGCGKSTLGRAVLQLIPSTAGQVLWLGRDLGVMNGADLRAQREQMQVIFQDPVASLNPRMTIGDIIGEPLVTHRPHLSRVERRAEVSKIMAKVGLLPEMINRYPHEFSGGQAQRIGIARAMVLEPKLIVCDEPVSALDVSIQAQIINLLQRLQSEFDLALIFISHDLSVVRHISHRIMVLYLGRMMELAGRQEIFDDPRHPYTKALMSAVPIPDPRRERNKERVVLTGDLPSPIDPPSGCVFRTRCPNAEALCAAEVPEPIEVTPGHPVACHFRDAPNRVAGAAS